MRGNRDLNLTVAAALLSAVLAIAIPVPGLSLIAAAPLLFFLPGYAIVCAAFARRNIDPARLLVLSVGLSLAVLALLPLLLDLLPGGITMGWWAVGLCVVVIATCRAAAIARPRPTRAVIRVPDLEVGFPAAAALAVAVVAGVGAMVLAFTPLEAKNAQGYTELWIEPLEGLEPPAVRVGVASREQEEAGYMLEFRVSGHEKPFAFEQLSLEPGEEDITVISVPAEILRPQVKVSVTLFKAGLGQPYRRVAAWTPPAAPP